MQLLFFYVSIHIGIPVLAIIVFIFTLIDKADDVNLTDKEGRPICNYCIEGSNGCNI